MSSMMTRLINKLKKKELRDVYVDSSISDVISSQIFNLRKSQNWSQRGLAKAVGMAQPRIALLEGADYENYTITTLKRLASVFDVALIVRFAPYSDLIKFKERFSSRDLEIPSFDDEIGVMEDVIREFEQRERGDIRIEFSGDGLEEDSIDPDREFEPKNDGMPTQKTGTSATDHIEIVEQKFIAHSADAI